MSDTTTSLSNLTLAELKDLVQGMVDDRLRVLLGGPAYSGRLPFDDVPCSRGVSNRE